MQIVRSPHEGRAEDKGLVVGRGVGQSGRQHRTIKTMMQTLVLLNLLVLTPNILRLHKQCYASQKMGDWSELILGREGMGK